MRILVAFGTRPEIIKLGPVCQALRRKPQVTMDVFWTDQHWSWRRACSTFLTYP
jgi:UDP-N-acetylglucosamine 2-epimerase